MANSLQSQGTLNRLRANVTIPAFPALAITAPFVGRRGISVAWQGETTVYLDTMTGAVTSPEPYVKASVVCHLVKSQPLANSWKLQLESATLLGNVTVRPDASTLSPWSFVNCSLQRVADMSLAGDDPEYQITIGGLYYINQSLFGG